MRAANNGGGPHGRTRGVREAVDVLTVDRLRADRRAGGHVRPLRAPRLGLGAARALPPPRGRHALRGRSRRRARPADGSRRAGRRRPSSRRREAGAGGASQRVLGHGRAERDAGRADPPRASRARHRPRAGRGGPGSPLGAVAERRRGDRAASLAEGQRPRSGDPARGPGGPLRERRPGDAGFDRRGRGAARPGAGRGDSAPLRVPALEAPRSGATPIPARCRIARSTPCAGSPRARSTSRSPRSFRSP